MSTTLLALDQKLLESLGDWKQHPVTTAINADTTVVSTHLQNYRSVIDYFNNYWIDFNDYANKAVKGRQITDDDGTSTLTIRGPNLLDDGTNLATFRISRTKWADRKVALISAINEIYPNLFRAVDNRILVTGNILPNSHFEDWTATTAPDFYTMQDANITTTALTTAGLIRGGTKSMHALTGAAGAGKYVYITSKNHPRLLDLMGHTITFKCWAYPQVANDAYIEIYTVKADGTTTQTLTSTTLCPAAAWTQLKLEDQVINDDIVEIQFRLKIATLSSYVYFDAARVIGRDIYEYLLPQIVQDGNISRVYIQYSGDSDDFCDDLQPRNWERVYGYRITNDGTYKYLELPYLYSSSSQIRLVGDTPLESLSADTDGSTTISLDSEKLNLLIAYAKYKLWQAQEQPPASDDINRYENASAKAYGEYMRLLPHLKMSRVSRTMNIPG